MPAAGRAELAECVVDTSMTADRAFQAGRWHATRA
jgi:hypothetical protein